MAFVVVGFVGVVVVTFKVHEFAGLLLLLLLLVPSWPICLQDCC